MIGPERARRDMLRFAVPYWDSRDIDPAYPVLKHLATGLTASETVRLCVYHVTYYDLGSTLTAYIDGDTGPRPEGHRLTTGTERRGNRTPSVLAANMASWADATRGDYAGYLLDNLPQDRRAAWRECRTRIEAVKGNGRWASYKLTELLAFVADAPLEPADMGHADSSGPRKGLQLLNPDLPGGKTPPVVAKLDTVSRALTRTVAVATDRPYRVEHVETLLCDFYSLTRSHYYVGHDIDHMLHQANRARPDVRAAILDARAATLPPQFLGEQQGWDGVRPHLKTLYTRTGDIAWW